MFSQPLNLLYIVLSISIIILTIFISWAIVYVIFILRELQHTTAKAKQVVERVDSWLIEPVKIANEIIRKIKFISNFVEERAKKRRK